MHNDQKTARVFFALWPDWATAAALYRLAREAQEQFGGRIMRRDTLHLTMAFIGAIPRRCIGELIDIGSAAPTASFELELDQLGAWKHNHIVWAGPSAIPAPLTALTEYLHDHLAAAGIELQPHPFVLHVTLLRNASCETSRIALAQRVPWQVRGLQLVESKRRATGAHYETLANWTVGG